MSIDKKDEMLRVRMKEGELEELKKKAEIYGMKNVSELVRVSINNFCKMSGTKTKEELRRGWDYANACDVSNMLFTLKNINHTISEDYNYENDPFDFCIPDNETLLDMHKNDIFRNIKQTMLRSIINDFNFIENYKIDKDTEKLLKELTTMYIQKTK